jgi:putative redox protein
MRGIVLAAVLDAGYHSNSACLVKLTMKRSSKPTVQGDGCRAQQPGTNCEDEAMKARIKWVEDRTFIGESGSGHKVVLGTASGPEARTPGPSPMELVLIGTGGCTAFDVVHILEKGRDKVEDCVIEIDADRAEKDPKVFIRIHMHFVVKGRALAAKKVERAIALSLEKYCSASAMLSKSATITHDFAIVDTGAAS